MANREAKVPDIGNYTNVPVIEVLVKAGDAVTKDQGLVTLESDKATMEVPAPFDGVVKEVKVKVGDDVSEGAVVAVIEAVEAGAAAPNPPNPPRGRGGAPAPHPPKAGGGGGGADRRRHLAGCACARGARDASRQHATGADGAD